jgi:hypothetical protein
MRPFRFAVVLLAGLLQFTVAGQAQPPWKDHWAPQTLSTAERSITVNLPDGWSLHEHGISISDAAMSDCHIEFVPTRQAPTRENFDQRVAVALDEDGRHSAGGIRTSLSHAANPRGVRLVSVRYGDRDGRLVEKRYFDLSSLDGDPLLEWVLTVPREDPSHDCVARFNIVASSFRVTSKPVTAPLLPDR